MYRHHLVGFTPDLLETLGSSVGASHGQQFVGPWSRIGLYHPGPALFYWNAPFVALGGVQPPVLSLATLTLVALSLAVCIGLVCRHVGWRAGALATVVMAGSIHQLHVGGLAVPWNPTTVILPVAVGLFALASVAATGSRLAASVGVTAGTLTAQSHFGSLPIGALIVLGSLGACVIHHRQIELTRRRVAGWVMIGLVTILPWVPVVFDQVAGTGNLGASVTYLLTGKVNERFPASPPIETWNLSVPGALNHLAALTSLTDTQTSIWGGPVFFDHHDVRPRSMVVLAMLVLVVGFGALGRRSRFASLASIGPWTSALCRVALLGLAVEVLAVLHVRGEFLYYFAAAACGVGIALWTAAVLTIAAVVVPIAVHLPSRLARSLRPAVAAVNLGLVALIAVVPAIGPVLGYTAYIDATGPVVDSLRDAHGPGLTFVADDLGALPAQRDLVVVLSEHGPAPKVEGTLAQHFSDYNRRARGGAVVRMIPGGVPVPAGCTTLGTYEGYSVCIER